MNKKAFTLAEVLITLAVIGVVAALAIPALLTTTSDAEYKTAFKKTYSLLNQAYVQVKQNECGGTFKNCFTKDSNDEKNSEDVKEAFAKYMVVTKKCSGMAAYNYGTAGLGVSSEGCFAARSDVKNYYGETSNFDNWGHNAYPGFVTNDGAAYSFRVDNKSCAQTPSGSSINDQCGHIYIDVNGAKKPNHLGKDIYQVFFRANNISPYGALGSVAGYCLRTDKTHGSNGVACAYKVLNNEEYDNL